MSASVFRAPKSVQENKAAPKKASVFTVKEKQKPQISDFPIPQQKSEIGNQKMPQDMSSEDLERMVERGGAQALSRLAEGALGLPGNISGLLNKVTGGKLPFVKSAAETLPTTEKLQQFSEKATRGYTTPQSDIEKSAGEFMQDVGSYLPTAGVGAAAGTGGRIINSLRQFQPVISPFLGQTAKKLGKKVGAGEGKQDILKIGSMIAFDVLANRGRGSQGYINHLWNEAEGAVQRGFRINSNQMRNELVRLQHAIESGGTSADKPPALTKISELLERMIQRGNNYFLDVSELPDFRRTINKVIEQHGGWQSEIPKRLKRSAIGYLNDVKDQVIRLGMEYGDRYNPRFAQYWSAANEASNVASRSNLATRFLEKTLGSKLFSTLMGGSVVGHGVHSAAVGKPIIGSLAQTAAATGLGAAVGGTAYNIGKITYRMARSPNLRNYYSHLFSSAVQQDANQVIRYANKIEKEEEKEKMRRERLIKGILKE